LQPETDLPNSCEISVSEHQLEGKADRNINKDNKETEKADKEKYEGKVVDRKGDGASLDSLLQKLPSCVSRNLIDQLTVRTDTIFLYVCTFETVMSYYS
jgi:regulator of nonsense transcripts 2